MNAVNPQAGAGQGRLAQVIATRGGLAAPEAPFVIEHREALIYMLCEAAELEHGIMCQYLFAAFTMKQSTAEGLTESELEAVTRWRKKITYVATQEMLHLALVQNLLSAIGAAPHMSRPNLPHPAGHYPAGVQLALLPFGEAALKHFMFLERPETYDLDDPLVGSAVDRSVPHLSAHDIVPAGQDFATVGHLYRSIEEGIAHLVAKYGESWLFVGPPRAQATQQHFGWPELTAVTGLASAQRAIDTILEQGEGPRGHWLNAHFGQFVAILDEYEQMMADNPGFDPVRPVIAANVRPCPPPVEMPLITDPLTARVTDLFNVGYEIMLQIFERFFAHTEETGLQLKVLADTTVALMFQVIEPLANVITRLPAGPEYGGRSAAPSFELFYENDYLMPHREAAWKLLAERLGQAALLCAEIQAGCGAGIAGQLAPVGDALTAMAATLAEHLPAGSPQARRALAAADRDPEKITAALARAHELANSVAELSRPQSHPTAATGGIAALFQAVYALAPAAGDLLPRLAGSVLRPLADCLTRGIPYGGGQPGSSYAGPGATDTQDTDALWQAARTATGLRATLATEGDCPPELIEATAALQALALDTVSASEAARRLAELRQLAGGLPPAIQVATDGPYLVTNVRRVVNHLGEELAVPPQLALCRCGDSARKPFCDGSHASNGFTGAKDPNRVPDRRDAYAGQQVTIFDNRGLCQHSGLCTDRLATVFRAGQEPFVAPSGGRMDEIIRAVRNCPSGALGFAIDGTEARAQTDWGNSREPAIEITKDGPYRITGGIGLTESGGAPVTRNEGASLEHCALCRCGHSQNKPFCSGMHWYINFQDPKPSAGPTLFEWAGGLPALTRMTQLLYEKHIPADPQLAAAFAGIPPGYPEQEAQRIAEEFGGPAAPARDGQRPTAGLTEDQRIRWVALAGQAATDAGLPADPPFRAALAAYLEWDSRQTTGTAQTRWDWTAAGPPDTSQDDQDGKDAQPMEDVPLPGPDEPVSFETHIRPLFREKDRQSMSFAFDLWSVDDVRTHAAAILARLQNGSMPCDGTWPAERIAVFQRWTETG
ncbi:MAG TPA: ferritin-like domain-containing protein [Streptosporangiaceae bacterium]|nr:ferritin-like domain-containing protein [Streptosporangiaceae bacterium]